MPATRGGLTTVEGASRKPVWANSLCPCGRPSELSTIWSNSDSGDRLTTNSPLARILSRVSLGRRFWSLWLSPRGPHENPSTGGSGQTTLKKLNGARLVSPALLMVDTHAIGRGMMESRSRKYISVGWKSAAASEMVWGAGSVIGALGE